jgi:hypothetical protein
MKPSMKSKNWVVLNPKPHIHLVVVAKAHADLIQKRLLLKSLATLIFHHKMKMLFNKLLLRLEQLRLPLMLITYHFNYTVAAVYIFLRFLSLTSVQSELFYLVYNEPQCSSTRLDHAVTVVGYGTDSGTPYWLVRNR